MRTQQKREKQKNKNLSEICIQRRYKNKQNEEIKKNIKIYEKLRRGISLEYSSSYQQATTQAIKLLLLKQKQNNIITGMREGEE